MRAERHSREKILLCVSEDWFARSHFKLLIVLLGEIVHARSRNRAAARAYSGRLARVLQLIEDVA